MATTTVRDALLINGKAVKVPGVRVLSPLQEPWIKLSAGDSQPRKGRPQQWMLHKAIADDPEHVIEAQGPALGAGGARDMAEMWFGEARHAGSDLITGHDGTVVCLQDLLLRESYNANQANALCVGHETKEVRGGGFYRSALAATVMTTLVGTEALGIQQQCPLVYTGKVLSRFIDGGKTLVGIFGHRDVSSNRNRWCPGDLLFKELCAQGVESFDFEAKQDLDTWARRQAWLKKEGFYAGAIDGIPGPATTSALAKMGYPGGIFVQGRRLAERLPVPT